MGSQALVGRLSTLRATRARIVVVVALAILALAIPGSAWAAPIALAYPSFTAEDASAFDFYGAASVQGDVIRLTDAAPGRGGQAFTKETVDLGAARSFSSHFSLLMANGSGWPADGMTFTIKRSDVTTLINGGGLGYLGVSPSVAVEFDTYRNSEYGDLWGDHVGLDVNGSLVSLTQQYVSLRYTPRYVWVDYNGDTDLLEVRVSSTPTRPASPIIWRTIDLAAVVGQYVNVGFTAGTGAEYQSHDVKSLYFSAEYTPTGLDPINETYTFVPYALSGSVSASPITTGRSTTVTALVTDIGGKPLSGEAVTFSGAGSFGAATGVTDASGQYSTTYTPPAVPGTYVVQLSGPSSLQDDVSVDVLAPGLSCLLSPSGITGGRSTSVSATVLDLGGQPMAGMPVTFSSAAGTFSPASGITNGAGEIITTFTPPATPGTYRVHIAGPAGVTSDLDVTVLPPSASIKFRGNSYRLTPATKADLRRVAQYAASINATVIVLEGHSATRYDPGTPRLRARLASRRAAAAKSYLRQQLRRYGNKASITITWYGGDVPIADNSTAAGRSLNRRVDVYMR